ncbi:hypothetical protein KsCSTR_01910 [Candidatus Kuenenia stuttgartiensis]|uniref:Uncharacterized protein n=1 Tax=Kuenenia stuttgartiensis TaxID=174633 RepID=Q1PUW5_KUEST|nr:hypothetical protein KsCSTR_01910 [Candidatus Kuenenia stuttgartiensis]CAJ71012.1 unknown protein [Candidatus Kuenenia stuttgartiensis]SOH04495.1 hypothetical protein KSMBR1_1997 [Candidatus Kuenenia stuttgartiensis]
MFCQVKYAKSTPHLPRFLGFLLYTLIFKKTAIDLPIAVFFIFSARFILKIDMFIHAGRKQVNIVTF